jgi:hypothetical protein
MSFSVCVLVKAISRMTVALHALHRRGSQRNPMFIRSGHTSMRVCIESAQVMIERKPAAMESDGQRSRLSIY